VNPRNPVVLIHGIDDTEAIFNRLRPFLQAQGWAVHSFNLVPNNGDAGLEELARQTRAYIERTFHFGQAVDVIGFSMGGLVARYYVQRLAEPDRIERLITISAPHRGSWTAFLRGNTGARQMRPGSSFLRKLDSDKQMLNKVRFATIWSPLDLMIVPANSSVIPEARSVPVTVVAHPLMIRDRRVLRQVERALQE